MSVLTQILDVTEDESAEFRHPGGVMGAYLLCDHTGGTVVLQVQTPDGDWLDLDGSGGIEFDGDGMQQFVGSTTLAYRLRVDGGVVGSKVWLVLGHP